MPKELDRMIAGMEPLRFRQGDKITLRPGVSSKYLLGGPGTVQYASTWGAPNYVTVLMDDDETALPFLIYAAIGVNATLRVADDD